ncbi:YgeY family selenium metabolism-linked hydrolase [Bdellovibrionota bacterium FG-1]
MKPTRIAFNPYNEKKPNYSENFLADDSLPFHRSLEGYGRTPLRELPALAKELGVGRILVKDEAHRFQLNAFKGLGAAYAIYRFIKQKWEEKFKSPFNFELFSGTDAIQKLGTFTFASATDGNHGRAVAWTARKLGQKAVIFMPSNTVKARIEAIRRENTEVVIVQGTYDDTVKRAAEEGKRNGWQIISDTAYEGYTEIPRWIMTGYTTIFREIDEELEGSHLPSPDVVIVQAGVGGLLCAAADYYVRTMGEKRPKLVCAEPLDADCLLESIISKNGAIALAKGGQNSIMAGLNCGTPSLLAWPVIQKSVHSFVAVDDDWARCAMKTFYHPRGNDPKITSGESGAAGLAVLLALCGESDLAAAKTRLGLNEQSTVLLINSEGDTDPESFKAIITTLGSEAEKYRGDCAQFLRELVAIPSLSTQEENVAARIVREMKKLGFDEAWTDDYGNVIGRVGKGPIRIVFDGHIDTVGIGNRSSWSYDPFQGKIENGYIYGRGASDNKAANAVQVYGAALFKKLGKQLDEVSVYVVGSVQEEDCDGLGLKYALEKSIGNVDFVCLGEATELAIYRGHRGRVEIEVSARGVSCHASAPERGQNAIYRMMKLVADIENLHANLAPDHFLGKGSAAVTHIRCETPSLCAVPDSCTIHIDRRIIPGETREFVMKQIQALPEFDPQSMEVKILNYDVPSYKKMSLETEKYYPSWVLPQDHPLTQAGIAAAAEVLGRKPEISRWVFSTNGVSSMGLLQIPTIGFGPGQEEDAHTTNDRVRIEDLVTSVAFYAALPGQIASRR